MKRLIYVVAMVTAIAALGLGLYFTKSDRLGSHGLAADIAGEPDKPRPIGSADDESPAHPARLDSKNRAADQSRGLGGSRLNLRVSIAEAMKKYGTHSRVWIGMVNEATGACSEKISADAPANPADPDHAWAIRYLDSACEGFDPSDYRYVGVEPSVAETLLMEGEAAAIEKATQDLKSGDRTLDLTQAGLFLMERNQFPNQADYGLDELGLAKAFGLASGLRTCAALNACGSDSLFTASFCALHGCPQGTSYALAMKSNLTPREYAAALKIKAWLAAQ